MSFDVEEEGDEADMRTGEVTVSIERGRTPWGIINFEVGDGANIRIEMKTNDPECVISGLRAMRGTLVEITGEEFAAHALARLYEKILAAKKEAA